MNNGNYGIVSRKTSSSGSTSCSCGTSKLAEQLFEQVSQFLYSFEARETARTQQMLEIMKNTNKCLANIDASEVIDSMSDLQLSLKQLKCLKDNFAAFDKTLQDVVGALKCVVEPIACITKTMADFSHVVSDTDHSMGRLGEDMSKLERACEGLDRSTENMSRKIERMDCILSNNLLQEIADLRQEVHKHNSRIEEQSSRMSDMMQKMGALSCSIARSTDIQLSLFGEGSGIMNCMRDIREEFCGQNGIDDLSRGVLELNETLSGKDTNFVHEVKELADAIKGRGDEKGLTDAIRKLDKEISDNNDGLTRKVSAAGASVQTLTDVIRGKTGEGHGLSGDIRQLDTNVSELVNKIEGEEGLSDIIKRLSRAIGNAEHGDTLMKILQDLKKNIGEGRNRENLMKLLDELLRKIGNAHERDTLLNYIHELIHHKHPPHGMTYPFPLISELTGPIVPGMIYGIASLEDLSALVTLSQTQSMSGMTFALLEDITIGASYSGAFMGIGTASNRFQGVFDGRGHKIMINRDVINASFINYAYKATIKNLELVVGNGFYVRYEEAEISYESNAYSLLIGHNDGSVYMESVTVDANISIGVSNVSFSPFLGFVSGTSSLGRAVNTATTSGKNSKAFDGATSSAVSSEESPLITIHNSKFVGNISKLSGVSDIKFGKVLAVSDGISETDLDVTGLETDILSVPPGLDTTSNIGKPYTPKKS